MPRYFFPSWDGQTFVPDTVGIDLAGVEQACVIARLALADMARDALARPSGECILEIRALDGTGTPVCSLRLTLESLTV